jgi:hypothetical protein
MLPGKIPDAAALLAQYGPAFEEMENEAVTTSTEIVEIAKGLTQAPFSGSIENQTASTTPSPSPSSSIPKSVFFLPKLESLFTALRYQGDFLFDPYVVDCSQRQPKA